MADELGRAHTHFSSIESNVRTATSAPSEPVAGDFYYDK